MNDRQIPAAVERPFVDSRATGTPPRAGWGPFVLLAPWPAVVVPLDRVPDPVFAQRLAGDGVSIDPTSTILLAPCALTRLRIELRQGRGVRQSDLVAAGALGLLRVSEHLVHVIVGEDAPHLAREIAAGAAPASALL